MNREDISHMAQEAGARAQQNKNCDVEYLFSIEQIQRLLVAAKTEENEACAKLFDDRDNGIGFYEPHEPAEIIRARSNND